MHQPKCRDLVRARAVSYDPSLHGMYNYLPCELCGQWTSDFELHHRKFRSRGGDWSPSNILLLCKGCHDLATNEEHPCVGVNVASHETPEAVKVPLWHTEGRVHLDDHGGYHSIDKG